MSHPQIEELVRQDPRYAAEAYEFVFAALLHTQRQLGRGRPDTSGVEEEHISGQQLLWGVRDLALREFGLLARTVFRLWGINRTGDFGDIVYNLINAGLMSQTERDERRHFDDVYDLDKALSVYRIELPQEAREA